MAYDMTGRFHYRYDQLNQSEKNFFDGVQEIMYHPLFSELNGTLTSKAIDDKKAYAKVKKDGNIILNKNASLTPGQWQFVIAHSLLHLAFGHFDKEKLPEKGLSGFSKELWNCACDLYIDRFLIDIKWGEALTDDPAKVLPIKFTSEQKIYEYLKEHWDIRQPHLYGTAGVYDMDMLGLEKPLEYSAGETNAAEEKFAKALASAVEQAVSERKENRWEWYKKSVVKEAAKWFVNSYPLLGGVAASFQIVEEQELCWKYEIQIAAVDASKGIIYANAAAGLTEDEWKFVLAHEYLHVALQHHNRLQGRNAYLWNIATDFVINGWLYDMKIGKMPDVVLYNEVYAGKSAEELYDELVKDIRKFSRMKTLRGYGKSDIFNGDGPNVTVDGFEGIDLDEFYRSALAQGLDYHNYYGRGYLPVGLIQEIKAMTEPPVPWDVELANWFDQHFQPLEKHHTYVRPSRRQGTTPDIPRPRYVYPETGEIGRVFAVVIDTSGSMGTKLIAKALGATASYAVSREVHQVRVIFCDAVAYDAGYMKPEEIADKVEIQGGGGTVLQHAINLIENAKDFPKNGPVLIITDGYIESDLKIGRKHAFLIPKGQKLPFKTSAPVFYLK